MWWDEVTKWYDGDGILTSVGRERYLGIWLGSMGMGTSYREQINQMRLSKRSLGL